MAVIEITKTQYYCHQSLALKGLGYWGSIVVQEKTRPTFSFHILGEGVDQMCTIHVDVRLSQQGVPDNSSVPADPATDIQTA